MRSPANVAVFVSMLGDMRRIVPPGWAPTLGASLTVALAAYPAHAQSPRDPLTSSIETVIVEEELVGATSALAGLLQWYAVLAAWGLAPLMLWR